MRIHVVALDRVFDTGLATILDAFDTANQLAQSDSALPPFEISVVGLTSSVQTALGFTVPAKEVTMREPPDWVVVPAIGFRMPAPLEAALARPETKVVGEALRGWASRGSRVAAACIGTFVLAESGLLDGHESTTTWWLAPLFRQRYAGVKLDESRMIVPSGSLVTAGAALSHMDLAIWLIRQKSPSLAALTARYLIADSRPSQSAYVLSDHLAHTDPVVRRFEVWARRNLAEGFSLDAAVAEIAASKRTLARRMQAVLGKTALSYFQDLRIERAVHLLKTTDRSVDAIATQVGYADGATLRTLLRRRTGQTTAEIRRGARNTPA
jgi:transcriptional regulator GlxA family with amidase domain